MAVNKRRCAYVTITHHILNVCFNVFCNSNNNEKSQVANKKFEFECLAKTIEIPRNGNPCISVNPNMRQLYDEYYMIMRKYIFAQADYKQKEQRLYLIKLLKFIVWSTEVLFSIEMDEKLHYTDMMDMIKTTKVVKW